jgi:hypothetical protein
MNQDQVRAFIIARTQRLENRLATLDPKISRTHIARLEGRIEAYEEIHALLTDQTTDVPSPREGTS